ncbi:OmpP1/FadL family transporter [Bacteroides sp.]
MKKKLTFVAGLLVAAASLSAQTVYDGAKLTDRDLNGTARFVGMGGAMGALGGDISTIGTNPAGIGVYRSNDFMTSFGFSSYGTESKYLGKSFNSNRIQGSFDNIGFVFASKIGNQTPLRYVNFGFNYHKAKSFYKNMEMGGNLGNYSQTFSMAEQAGGIFDWPKNPFNDPNGEIGWLSAVGYEGYLLNLRPGTDDQYLGMYNGADAHFRSQERGGIDQYDFNVSFNINDRVYLGLTIGAYAVDYRKYTYYSEAYTGVDAPQNYNLQGWNKVRGSGFDIKFGTIIRPFEYSPFRIGLAVHTPTFYNLDYKTSVYLESDVLNAETGKIDQWSVDSRDYLNGGGDMIQQFRLQTPWVFNGSLGYTVGKSLALGAEYEYKDYSSMKFRDAEGYADSYSFVNSKTSELKGVHTIRLGAEYKVIPEFAVRAGYNYSTAAFHTNAFKDLPFNSIQTDTDFANTKAMSNYTLGIGYRGSMFYADLAYKFSTYKEDFFPFTNPQFVNDEFDPGLPHVTKVTNTRSQVLFTLGLRF